MSYFFKNIFIKKVTDDKYDLGFNCFFWGIFITKNVFKYIFCCCYLLSQKEKNSISFLLLILLIVLIKFTTFGFYNIRRFYKNFKKWYLVLCMSVISKYFILKLFSIH